MKRSLDENLQEGKKEEEEEYSINKRFKNNSSGGDEENIKVLSISNSEKVENRENLQDRVKETDIRVLTALKNKLGAAGGEALSENVEKVRQQYLINYMKTVIEKLPLSQQLIDTRNMKLGDDVNEYFKMFSVARTCVHTQMQVQKLNTFNAIFDMMIRIVGKGVHDRVITPYLKNVVSKTNLDLAYASFQQSLTDGNDSQLSNELHCVTYLIQTEMEKNAPLKIPNPIFNRFTQQLKATSRYVTTILSSLASQPILPMTPAHTTTSFIPNNINNNNNLNSDNLNGDLNTLNDNKIDKNNGNNNDIMENKNFHVINENDNRNNNTLSGNTSCENKPLPLPIEDKIEVVPSSTSILIPVEDEREFEFISETLKSTR